MNIGKIEKKFQIFLILIFLINPGNFHAKNCFAEEESLNDLFSDLMKTIDTKQQEIIQKEILKIQPDCEKLKKTIQSFVFEKIKEPGLLRSESACIDGKIRPFYWVIPKNYKPSEPVPLLVYLHGGVGREKLLEPEEVKEFINEDPFFKYAEKEGIITLCPMGQAGTTWWDTVGAANILTQVRLTKMKFNIDDDRVYMAGFSDGGSGSFFFAMTLPTDFACFIALNGHMGVASIDNGRHTYLPNLNARAVYAVNTEKDRLYPASQMRETIKLAIASGADIEYREFKEIGHSMDYAEGEMDRFDAFMVRHPRSPFPCTISIEATEEALARRDWLKIDKIYKKQETPVPIQRDFNMNLTDDRISFGFFSDENYKGKGVRVERLMEGETVCSIYGVQSGDIITGLDEVEIADMDGLSKFKEQKNRGDKVLIKLLRNEKEMEIKARFPEKQIYALFPRIPTQAMIKGFYYANNVEVTSEGVEEFTIFIHSDFFEIEYPVKVVWNGEIVWNNIVNADPDYMLKNYIENRDRKMLYVNELHFIRKPGVDVIQGIPHKSGEIN